MNAARQTQVIPIDEILERLRVFKLSPKHKTVVKKFKSNPKGRGFLPLVSILFELGMDQEAFSLLQFGIERHPSFTPARIVAAEEYLSHGSFLKAWEILEESPVNLRDYVPAQILKFKLAILLLEEKQFNSITKYLRQSSQLDLSLQRFVDLYEVHGLKLTQKEYLAQLRQEYPRFFKSNNEEENDSPPLQVDPSSKANKETAAASLSRSEIKNASFDNIDIAGFSIIPVSEVATCLASDRSLSKSSTNKNDVELDSLTLAEIYEKQGFYTKALGIYRRLSLQSPGNLTIKTKISELSQLQLQEKLGDLQVNSKVVEKIETVEVIDRKIAFFQNLLEKINQRSEK